MPDARMVALLRGVNVGGNRRVAMAALREVAEGVGLTAVETVIQSGNLVFTSSQTTEHVADGLESGILARFGFSVGVVVRTKAQWHRSLSTCPYPIAATERPHLLHLCLSRRKPPQTSLEGLRPLCSPNEAIALVGDTLWIDYADGAARSKVTSAVLDRAVGATVTARNWKTAQLLATRLG